MRQQSDWEKKMSQKAPQGDDNETNVERQRAIGPY